MANNLIYIKTVTELIHRKNFVHFEQLCKDILMDLFLKGVM